MMVKQLNPFNAAKQIKQTKLTKRMWWRFLWLSLPMLGLMILSSYFLRQAELQAHLDSVRMETGHHIESQTKNMRVEIRQAALHVRFLAQHSEVSSVLQGEDGHALNELSHDFHAFSKYMGVYDQVRLLNRHGREVVRASLNETTIMMTAAEDLQDKSKYPYFRQAIHMPPETVFISKFTLNVEHGHIEMPLKSVLRFAAPVFGADGEKLGVVVLNFLGKVLIERYLDATDVRGENMFLNANSYFFHAADENSTWGSVLKKRENNSLIKRFPQMWKMIVDQRNGQVLTEQGLFTFATISPYGLIGQAKVPGQGAGDWVVVSYVSNEALYDGAGSISALFMVASLLLLILWLMLAWKWARSEMQREQLLAEKHELLRSQMDAQEEERSKLARSLHDDMGQSLTSIRVYATAIAKGQLDEKTQQAIQHIGDITRHIQHLVRNQLHDLRPSSLERLGLPAALEDMLEAFSQREQVSADFECQQDLPVYAGLSDEQNIHLFRIVQEALTNVAKYAQASRVKVQLRVHDDILYLSISDNGCGMDVVRESGLGLLGMRERSELLHGTIQIESALADGVSIHVQIPIGQR